MCTPGSRKSLISYPCNLIMSPLTGYQEPRFWNTVLCKRHLGKAWVCEGRRSSDMLSERRLVKLHRCALLPPSRSASFLSNRRTVSKDLGSVPFDHKQPSKDHILQFQLKPNTFEAQCVCRCGPAALNSLNPKPIIVEAQLRPISIFSEAGPASKVRKRSHLSMVYLPTQSGHLGLGL